MSTEPIFLAPRQLDTLNAISIFIEQNHYPPSIADIGAILGVSSSSTVHFHLAALKKAGVINFEPCAKRTLRLTEKAKDAQLKYPEPKPRGILV